MKIPVWIGTPVVLALATTDAVLDLQTRAVGALTRAVMRRMFIGIPIEAPPDGREGRHPPVGVAPHGLISPSTCHAAAAAQSTAGSLS
ncbi:hypothetical protein C8K38_11094 [Rhodococcus sp. OK611]|jgi:hypothetical protein|uniref:hypothetical protein n=1 Tax=unclassified Rhodococcus (in: high G+C Gram-positive bacteria) TaxID=192944 RepID=UPI000BD6E99B|nr:MULTISPECIES: hypothetical protein [unclassified Rhodococcus (in: high G+C Gram-positive bacteria)]PTR42797.1 hypothetical protein C8K38_11094 [Rhodococcus sp. OK611]SNX91846.1 hypothetical protein SAMN05447004_111133 [Rhodococcus sp. OK270]